MSSYEGEPIYSRRGSVLHETICFSYDDEHITHGIFFKEDRPLKFILPVFMVQIIMAFILSRLVYFVLRPLRQPKFVCNVLAGIVLGPSVFGRNKKFMETFYPAKEMLVFNTLVKLGISYFIFLTAVKRDIASMLKKAKNVWAIAISSYLFPIVFSHFFPNSMKNQILRCLRNMPFSFIGFSLTQSLFSAVANNLEEQDLITTELGQLAISCSMLTEAFTALLSNIYVLVLMFSTAGTYFTALKYLLQQCTVIFFAIYVIRPALLQISKKTPEGQSVNEFFVIAILVGALIMVLISDILWISFVPGALIMGFLVPDGPPLGSTIVQKSELMITQFFLPLFYIQVGFLTDVSSIKDMEAFFGFFFYLFMLNLSKTLAIALASVLFDIRFKNAFLLGLILNFKGIEDFTMYERWRADKLMNNQNYATLILFCLFSNSITFPLTEILYKPHVSLTTTYLHGKAMRLRTLQSTPKDVELRVLSCVFHEGNVHGLITLLKFFNPSKNRAVCAYITHLVDLVGRSAPLLIPYNKYKKRFVPKCSHHIMRAFNNFAADNNKYSGPITVQPFIAVAPYKSMHNIICNLAQDRQVPLIIVPFGGHQEVNTIQSCVRNFNAMLQLQASCTIGILIDRGLSLEMINSNHSFNVAVLFAGGADDREALALASRMSGNPKVGVTVFKIRCKQEEGLMFEMERQLDEIAMNEFKEKTAGNASVVCSEMAANNGLQMMEVIRSLRKNYSLVIVGKNIRIPQFQKEMKQWVEYVELGLLGDVLASSDFRGSSLSVLVVKRSELDDGYNHQQFCIKTIESCNPYISCREEIMR